MAVGTIGQLRCWKVYILHTPPHWKLQLQERNICDSGSQVIVRVIVDLKMMTDTKLACSFFNEVFYLVDWNDQV